MEQDKNIPNQLPLFVADAISNGSFIMFDEPKNLVVTADPQGNDQVKLNVSSLDRLKIQLLDISERPDLAEAQRHEAALAYHCFNTCLKSITFEFKDETRNDPPEILYEHVDVNDLWMYQDPTDPDYLAYIKQVEILNDLKRKNEPIPGTLMAYCKDAEQRFFVGEENRRKRQSYIQSLIEGFLGTPSVQFAILSIFYSPDQVTALLDRLEAEDAAARPKKKTAKKAGGRRSTTGTTKPAIRTTFRKAGHALDEMLKRIEKSGPPAGLKQETELQIKTSGVERSSIYEGIRLTSAEHKLVDGLSLLLHQKSQNEHPDKEDYYSGNGEQISLQWGAIVDEKNNPVYSTTPQLKVSLYELAKAYKGEGEIGGKDVSNVYTILLELSKKPFLIRHTETTWKSNGGRTERSVESFRPLIRLEEKFSEVNYDFNNVETSRREELLITLSPLFIRQIDTKYVEYPSDITARTVKAYGKGDIPRSTYLLREYLMNERSYKRFNPEIDQKNLHTKLCADWVQLGMKKRVLDYVDRAIRTMQSLGLLKDCELVEGAKGQLKYVFHINEKWQ